MKNPLLRRVAPFFAGASLVAGALFVISRPMSTVEAAPTVVKMRDPSTIVKRGSTFYVFGTGQGVSVYSSTDLKNWRAQPQVFAQAPAWTKTEVPDNKNNIMWAPDIHQWGGTYHLYYSFSSLGSNQSGIGLATSTTLAPGSWTDKGPVILSKRGGNFNAIDPSVFTDFEGKKWMAYGSYWSGLKMTALEESGKRAPNAAVIDLATTPNLPLNAIEAPAIYPHDGWYYCFVTWFGGPRYNTRVGRSKSPTGPFLDKTGKALNQGGGSLFLTSFFDPTGPSDDQNGPGHVGILRDGDKFYVSTHYEFSRANRGATTMNLSEMIWDADGWPRVVLDEGPWKMVSALPAHNVITATGGTTQTDYFRNSQSQFWRVQHRGGGFYSLTNADTKTALGVVGEAKPGAALGFSAFANRDSQLWFARQNEDGTYGFECKAGGQTLALDVAGCSNLDGAGVALWTKNDAACQKWSLRVRG